MTDKALNQGVSSGHSNQCLCNGMSQVGGVYASMGNGCTIVATFEFKGKVRSTRPFQTIRDACSREGGPIRKLPRLLRYVWAALPFLIMCSTMAFPVQNDFRQSLRTLRDLPLGFERNLGQASPGVRFLTHGDGYFLYLNGGEFVIAFMNPADPALWDSVHVAFVGAEPNVEPEGIDPLPGVTHYYIGSDPKAWLTSVKRSRKVRYRYLYPGIDLIFYSNGPQMEFDFEASPGADVSRIVLRVEGATVQKSNEDLELVTPRGQIAILRKPNLYQMRGDKQYSVQGEYSIENAREVTFAVSEYDKALPLTIDPALVYSTLFQELMQSTIFAGQYPTDQNFEKDFAYGIATDSAGSTYITGEADLPDPSQALQGTPTLFFSRAFVIKLDPTGSKLEYSAYLGSKSSNSAWTSRGSAITVDLGGNAYIAGDTLAPDFPITAGTYSTAPVCPGGSGDSWSCDDPFAAKLDATGMLVYSTFLVRGPASDTAGPSPLSAAVDANGALYIGGTTLGPATFGMPPPRPLTPTLSTTSGAFQTNRRSDSSAFIIKLHPDGSQFDYATYLGGSTSETLGGIAVDSNGVAYLDGGTASADFPTTAGAFQQASPGKSAFLSKLSADGSSLLYSTFLGAAGLTAKATGIAVDGSKGAYLTGETSGPGFPTTAGAFKTNVPPPPRLFDAIWPYNFVSKFDVAGNLSYSTYLGYGMAGEQTDRAEAIAVDSTGGAYVTGSTVSPDYPAVNSIQPFPVDAVVRGAVFVTKLNPGGSGLVYSTFVVNPVLRLIGIALDSNHDVYVAEGDLTGGPTTSGAFQTVAQGSANSGGFVFKLADSLGVGVAIPVPRQVVIPLTWQMGTTSPPSTVILGNYGDAALSITGISVSGGNASDFAQTNDCGATLPVGTNCTIDITFSPTVEVGTRNSTLGLTFGGSVPAQSVSLSGQAAFPIIQITPALSINFGSIGVGTFDTADLEISNVGTGFLNLGYAFTGDFSGEMFGGFLGILPPGGAAPPLRVSFTPMAPGLRTGQLVITDNAAGSPHVVQFSGNGIAVNAGDFTLTTAPNSSNSVTIVAGQAATYDLLAVSGAGFSDSVTLTCAGFPINSTCAVDPKTFLLGGTTFIGTSPQGVKISVNTAPHTSSSSNSPAMPWYGLISFAGMLLMKRPRRRISLVSLVLLPALIFVAVFASCGGGQPSPPPSAGTPAGTYPITLTATSGKLTHNIKLTLIVQ